MDLLVYCHEITQHALLTSSVLSLLLLSLVALSPEPQWCTPRLALVTVGWPCTLCLSPETTSMGMASTALVTQQLCGYETSPS